MFFHLHGMLFLSSRFFPATKNARFYVIFNPAKNIIVFFLICQIKQFDTAPQWLAAGGIATDRSPSSTSDGPLC